MDVSQLIRLMSGDLESVTASLCSLILKVNDCCGKYSQCLVGSISVFTSSSILISPSPPSLLQINELSNVPVPVMLMPDDFKAYSKIKVDNHLFNKYVSLGECIL